MRICDIDIYRDGGSISFRVEREGEASLIWLDTPSHGEPRALQIISVPVHHGDPDVDESAADVLAEEMRALRDSSPVRPGDAAVIQLLADIEEWLAAVPRDVQDRVRELMSHRGPYYVKPGEEAMMHRVAEVDHVATVRDYVAEHYVRVR